MILGLTFEFIFVLCYVNIIQYNSQILQSFFTLIVIIWLFILLFDFKSNCKKDKSITFYISIHKLFFEPTKCALTANTIAFVGIIIGFTLYSLFTQYWAFFLFTFGFHAALCGDILTHIRIWYCRVPKRAFEDYRMEQTDKDEKLKSQDSLRAHDITLDITPDQDRISDEPNLIDTLQIASIKIVDT